MKTDLELVEIYKVGNAIGATTALRDVYTAGFSDGAASVAVAVPVVAPVAKRKKAAPRVAKKKHG